MGMAESKNTIEISISVVSHSQINLIESLLSDINRYCLDISIELILTLNLKETLSFALDDFSFPIKVISNLYPLGFAANHNQAFKYARGQYFCVINPDIRLSENPFHVLIPCLQDTTVGVVAPLVVGETGTLEDSARKFPTPLRILCKALGGYKGSDYIIQNEPISPDWVGGMLMLFRRERFESVGGFNEKFFLYYEDVDLCARLRLLGYKTTLCPTVRVMHNARRSSHHSYKYFKWHLTSMLQFFCSMVFIRLFWLKLRGTSIK